MTDVPRKKTDTFRLLHTADWHLGKLLNEQSREEEHRLFLSWLLKTVKEHKVDGIILAGDVFDSANPPQSAQSIYFNFVSELYRQGNCNLAIIAGNHDSAAHLESPKQVLETLNAHVVGFLPDNADASTILLPTPEAPRVAIAMVPFLRDRDLRLGKAGESGDEIRAQLIAGISQRYEEAASAAQSAAPNCPLIATGHLTVAGTTTSDSERDIHIGGLGAVTSDKFPSAFSYVALGHLHRPQSCSQDDRIRYSGSPIALSFSEASDKKEVRILDIDQDSITQHSIPIPVFRKLIQLKTTTAELESTFSNMALEEGELTTWLEVVIEDASLVEDVTERVQELAEGKNVEVLKVLKGTSNSITGLSAEGASDDEAIETLLDNPRHVFDHLIEEHPQITESEADTLRTTFATLMDLDAETEPEGSR